MHKHINEKTSIPLTWVLAAYVPTTTFVLTVALWVFHVNERLSRIEQRLAIVSQSVPALIESAGAKEK